MKCKPQIQPQAHSFNLGKVVVLREHGRSSYPAWPWSAEPLHRYSSRDVRLWLIYHRARWYVSSVGLCLWVCSAGCWGSKPAPSNSLIGKSSRGGRWQHPLFLPSPGCKNQFWIYPKMKNEQRRHVTVNQVIRWRVYVQVLEAFREFAFWTIS